MDTTTETPAPFATLKREPHFARIPKSYWTTTTEPEFDSCYRMVKASGYTLGYVWKEKNFDGETGTWWTVSDADSWGSGTTRKRAIAEFIDNWTRDNSEIWSVIQTHENLPESIVVADKLTRREATTKAKELEATYGDGDPRSHRGFTTRHTNKRPVEPVYNPSNHDIALIELERIATRRAELLAELTELAAEEAKLTKLAEVLEA